ncbi:DUF6193 family natural product biosynthesis protein [Niabella sp. 22666]|uniref:DUF6193 family natural product biosynthesis protein n=1 Tax=Niabella sp. 22666 TaxID=3453954 RepID=UPI003F82EDFC
MTKTLYPEIKSAGGLIFALDNAFTKIGSALRVYNDDDPKFLPGAYARIEKEHKFSQIYLAAEEKLYLPDFWRDGVCLGHGGIDNIDTLVQCVDYWLTNNVSTKQLSNKFDFVTPSKDAAVFDEGNEVQHTWNSILNDPYRKEIKSFVELAVKDSVLSSLFPYTSLMTLCFSRCTGYPFTYDTPTVSPILDTDQYLVRHNNNDIIGSGSAIEALKMVLDNLPEDIAPAAKGTSETYKNVQTRGLL